MGTVAGGGYRGSDRRELAALLALSEPAVRHDEVGRARDALAAREGSHPVDAIASVLIDCLVRRRLP